MKNGAKLKMDIVWKGRSESICIGNQRWTLLVKRIKRSHGMWKNIKKEKKGRSETTAITESNMSHVYPSVWIDAG